MSSKTSPATYYIVLITNREELVARDMCDCVWLSDPQVNCEVVRRGAVIVVTRDLLRFLECISMEYFQALVSRFYVFEGLADDVCGDLLRFPVGEGPLGGRYCEVSSFGSLSLGRVVDWQT